MKRCLFVLGLAGCAGPTVAATPPSAGTVAAPQQVVIATPATPKQASVRPPAVAPPLAKVGEDVTADFDVAEGLSVTTWASSPQLMNPTNMDFDARGRAYVTEGVNYRRGRRHSEPGDGYAYHPKGDRVMILEDTDGDGSADSSKVFVEDPDLVSPLGIAVLGNRVFVSASPGVFVYTDTNGDDKADQKEVFLSGFGGVDHDHGVHAFSGGPDGHLYFNTGNEGPHNVKDKSGWTLRKLGDSARPEVPKSDDGRKWLMGVILRIDADGKGLRPLAHNFRNNYEVSVDSYGSLWQNDNDDDGNESCRFTFVMEGGSYGYASAGGQRRWNADRREGQSKQQAHWHQEDPGVVPPTEVTGAGAPTGLVVAERTALGKAPDGQPWDGIILNADSGRSTIYAHRTKPLGAGFASVRTNFLKTKDSLGDKAKWFRPSDVAVGPDGAIYVADWYDAVVGGHAMLDAAGGGRILRIARKGDNPKTPVLNLATTEGQVTALASPAVNVRFAAVTALAESGVAALPALKKTLASTDPLLRARALWLVARLANKDAVAKRLLQKELSARDPNLRITALRALRQQAALDATALGGDLEKALSQLAKDPSPAVRREVAVALRDRSWKDAGRLLKTLAAGYDGKDRIYLEALGIAAEGKESELFVELQKTYGAKSGKAWSPRFADFAWRLHPKESTNGWRERAQDAKASMESRRRALVALAFVPSPEAASVVLDVAETVGSPDQTYALVLALRRADAEWKTFGLSARLADLQERAPKDEEALKIVPLVAVIGNPQQSVQAQQKAVEELVLSPAGGRALVGLAAQKKLPEALKEIAAAKIFSNPDPGVRALASKHFSRPAFDGVEFPPVAKLLEMKGDAVRGRVVFFSPQAACASCHEHGGQGKAVGPALTKIADKLGRDALFDSILNPSAGIAFGYDPWVVVTKSGATYTGFIVADGDMLVMKDLSGEHRYIPAKDVVLREKQTMSLMPDNIALGMKPEQLVDLVEFLRKGNP